MAAQQFLPGLPDRALHHGRYHTSRSRHENTRCGDAFFSPKSEIEVSVPKQAPSKPKQSKLRTTRSLVTASGHQLYGSGRNRDRFGVQGDSHDISYLNFRFFRSCSTVGLVFKQFSSSQALINNFELQYCNRPIGNRCAVRSINEALGSVTNERLPCFLNGLARLSPYNIQTRRKLKCPLKTGWR